MSPFILVTSYILTRSASSILFTLAEPSLSKWYWEVWFLADLWSNPILTALALYQKGPVCRNYKHHAYWGLVAVIVSGQYFAYAVALAETDPASFELARNLSLIPTLTTCHLLFRPVPRMKWIAALIVVLSLIGMQADFTYFASWATFGWLVLYIGLSVTSDYMIDYYKTDACFNQHVSIATDINFIIELVAYFLTVSITWPTLIWEGWLFTVIRMINNTLYYLALVQGKMHVEALRVAVIPSNVLTLLAQTWILGIPFPYTAIPNILLLFIGLFLYRVS